jgi:CDP-diacylglycerol--serine O-phosphatidyltransferase
VAYQFGVARLGEYNLVWGRLGWLATFLYAACAAMRLARFNARAATADKRFFEGLPSPSAAATVAGFIWIASENELSALPTLVLAFVITSVIGLLMVSSFAYWSGKELNLRGRVRWTYLLILPIGYILIGMRPAEALFALFACYAFHAPVLWLWRRIFHRRPHDSVASKS